MTTETQPETRPDTAGSSDDKIASQIEYYFGDYNLRKDKFLKEKIAEADGWVDLDVLLTFNRLKALTEDRQEVVAALKKANIVGDEASLLTLNEEETRVKRVKPLIELSEEEEKALNDRIIHFKGIPEDATLEEIKTFCSQYGQVESVEMRKRREDRKFKGCVMTVYASKEDAQRAMEGKEVYSPDLKFLRETKTQYVERRATFFAEKKKKKDLPEAGDANSEEVVDEDPVKTKGVVLVLSEFDGKGFQFREVKNFFNKFGDVKYVDFLQDKQVCYIRFSKEEELALAIKECSNETDEKRQITLNDKTYPVSVLDGEEEVDYWRKIGKAISAARRENGYRKKGKGFRRGGGGYKGSNDRKRPAGDAASQSRVKQVKVEPVAS